MPYPQKYSELQELAEELTYKTYYGGDPIRIISFYMLTNVVEQHDIYVRSVAYFNAIRAAIEIFLIKAETGQLPDALQDDLPKDPFSGQDFEYEVTEEGFSLRCWEKEISENRVWQYEFKVQD